MQDKLKQYLTEHGYKNIYIDFMPAAEKVSDAIGLMKWDAPVSQTFGEVTHYIQIQIRRKSYDEAKNDCRSIMELFDSGMDERLIWLDEVSSCIARPRRAPLILERGAGYTTFYCEIAIWMNE